MVASVECMDLRIDAPTSVCHSQGVLENSLKYVVLNLDVYSFRDRDGVDVVH